MRNSRVAAQILSKSRSGWLKTTTVLVILLFCSFVLGSGDWSVGPSYASSPPSSGTPAGAGLHAAAWLLTLPYGAIKVAFALGGGIVGGLTYAVSAGNVKAAQSVWVPSMYGDYTVKPEHLSGKQTLRFIGKSDKVS